MNILAQNDTAHTLRDTPCVINVLANDIGEGLVVQSVTQPANGTVSNGGTNVVYTPALDFEGTNIFSYGLGSLYGSAIGQVTVTVSHVIIN